MDDLRRIDLNLLLSLNALLEERHVTRAAKRLNRSQPAMSHALAQLRGHFDDPLLMRGTDGLELTGRARQLQRPLRDALFQLNALIAKTDFDPRDTRRQFRLALSDYASRIVLPRLARHVRHHAPGIELAIVQGRSRESMIGQLIDGDLDLALGIFDDPPPAIRVAALFHETFLCVADRNAVPRDASMAFEDWLSRPHVMLALQPDAIDEIDQALLDMGRKRTIALALPHWSVALDLIQDTDLILTVAKRATLGLDAHPALLSFAPPLALPGFTYHHAWHKRRDADPGHAWLRHVITLSGQDE